MSRGDSDMRSGRNRRYRRGDGGEVRRMVMALWCRIRMGDDSWSEGWSEMLAYGVLLLLLMFGLGFLLGSEARGDLIIAVESVGGRVYAGHDVAVPLPYDLGYLSFNQAETHEGVPGSGVAMMSVGPAWSDGFGGSGLVGSGVALGAISIQTVDMLVDGWPRVVWDGFGRTIGYSEQAAMDGVLWGSGAGDGLGLPSWVAGDGDPDGDEAPVWVPFQWERFERYSIAGLQPAVRGSGWVSLKNIAQMVPVIDPVTGVQWITGSGYTVDTVVLAQLDVGLRSGELPDGWSGGGGGSGGGTAVPEPGGIAGMLAAAAVAAGYGAWKRRRMGSAEGRGLEI